jgi:hypothetical protein
MPNENNLKKKYDKLHEHYVKDEKLSNSIAIVFMFMGLFGISVGIAYMVGMGAFLMSMSQTEGISVDTQVIGMVQGATINSAFISSILVSTSVILISFFHKNMETYSAKKIKNF